MNLMRVDFNSRGQQSGGACARGPLRDQTPQQRQPRIPEESRFLGSCGEHVNGVGDRAIPADPQLLLGNHVIGLGVGNLMKDPGGSLPTTRPVRHLAVSGSCQ